MRLAVLVLSALLPIACGRSAGRATADGGLDAPLEAPASEVASDVPLEAPDGAPPTTLVVLDHVGVGSIGSAGWANVGGARAEVDWKQGPFANVRLVVDLESACFPFSKWSADPPPAGQNWPADCDAFDRNFDVFVDDTVGPAPDAGAGSAGDARDAGADGPVFGPAVPASADWTPFEVIHAITPFGGPEHLEVDLTDLANARPGKHALRVELLSYPDSQGMVTGSNGGWTVSARIEIRPGDAPRHVLAVVPLYLGAIGAGDPFPTVSWEVPAGTVAGRLEYRTSGHGQGTTGPRCVGPAEEFCDRRHQLFVDGAMIDNIEPYRQDCQTLCTVTHYGPPDGGFDYCAENPCGAVDSVEAPRANWCPGSLTPPFVWDGVAALAAPGPHTFAFQILNIIPGGTWMASASYTAYGP